MNQAAEFKHEPLWRRLWNRPGVRGMSLMLFRLLVFIALTAGLSYAMRYLIPLPRLTPSQSLSASGWELWLRAIRSLIPTVLAYWLLVRFVERRKVSELAANKFLTHSTIGWLVGMGIMLVAAGAMMAVAGAYRIDGVNEDAYLVGPLVVLGLLLGMAYAWTRSLWFCMGLHGPACRLEFHPRSAAWHSRFRIQREGHAEFAHPGT